MNKDDLLIYAIGNKGREALERRGYHIELEDSAMIESPSYEDASALCKKILKSFTDGEIGEIYLAYTHFKNTVSHEPKLIKLLPVEIETGDVAEDTGSNVLMNYEPTTEEALDMIIPKYVTSLFYGALVEAVASENGARMQAMDSATSNAEEMISNFMSATSTLSCNCYFHDDSPALSFVFIVKFIYQLSPMHCHIQ